MEKDNVYRDIYKRARDCQKILTIQYMYQFLYISKIATWKLSIPTELEIRSKSVQEQIRQLANTYTGVMRDTSSGTATHLTMSILMLE